MSGRVCVIGAGPSGLAAARALQENGLAFDVFERHRDVGGIWDLENPGTPMYESAHFISSRTQSAFDGFPMPDDFADYPSRERILAYLRAFADAHRIRERITFGASVERVARVHDGWEVTVRGASPRTYGAVIAAMGHQWESVLPSYSGTFTGTAIHSKDYRSAKLFEGKRVLVVGAGNSGCDIVCDAAARGTRAMLSVRRGYYVLPKHIFGQPTDAFFRSGPHIPPRIAQPALTLLLRLLVGDLTRFGMPKPDHKVLETHPIVSAQLVYALQHGDVSIKPDVEALDGDHVRFTDGTREAVDVIIYATGYRDTIPFLLSGGVDLGGGVSGLWMNVFARAHENLFVIGLFETDGAAYPVVSKQGELVARYLAAKALAPDTIAWLDALRRDARPDLHGGVRYLGTPRHAIYVQFDEYMHVMEKLLKRLPRQNGAAAARSAATSGVTAGR